MTEPDLVADLRRASIWGCGVWVAYATTEFLFFATLPLFFPSGGFRPDMVAPWYWPLAVKLLVVHGVIGAASGLLVAGGLRLVGASIREHASILTLVLVSMFCLHLGFVTLESGSGWRLLAAPLLLLAALVVGRRRGGLALLANPWVASFCLVGSLWLARSDVRLGAWIAPAAVLALIGLLALKGRGLDPVQRRPVALPFWRHTLSTSMLLLILQGCAASLVGSEGLAPERIDDLARGDERPNVLLVSLDTARADHFSVYGYARNTSPNLQALAKRAVVYENATAAANHTLPAHASIFTGLYPSWHGAHKRSPADWGRELRPEFDTLAEVLRGEGYLTAAVVANVAYMNSGWGMGQGFQLYDDATPLRFLPHPTLLRSGIIRLLERLVPTAGFYRITRRAEEVNEVARSILDQAEDANTPVFLFLNYMDTHRPYLPPASFIERFESPETARRYRSVEEILIESGHQAVSPEELHHVIAHYDAAIAYLDHALGELIQHLDATGRMDDTLLIITSDHGEAFGEHGFLEHGSSPHQEQVHVPLLIKYPGAARVGRVEARVGHTDLFPTILDVVGVQPRHLLQGRSLIGDTLDPQRQILSESFPSYQGGTPRDVTQRALLQGAWKLILSDGGASELYRLAEDAGEQVDLGSSRPESERLRGELLRWLEQVPDREQDAQAGSDRDVFERLKSLGYIE